jgi:LAO/AO transport system kinase
MRLIDDRVEGYRDRLKDLYRHTGRAHVLGVTGTPGVGKSTLVDRAIEHHRALGRKVGVVAVDPSSPLSGGAILGDRIRMQRHFLDDQVFIRSLATRGHLGGLSRSAGDIVRVLDAFGCDVIVVETVGVGQDELEIARLAHTTVVVIAPGGGDDIQAIKAGILEVGDIFAVNKADRDGADATVRDLEGMLALDEALVRMGSAPRGHSAAPRARTNGAAEPGVAGVWVPPVVKCVATRSEGMQELMTACDRHRAFLGAGEAGEMRLRQRREEELALIFRERLLSGAHDRLRTAWPEAHHSLHVGRADPYVVADELVARVLAPD